MLAREVAFDMLPDQVLQVICLFNYYQPHLKWQIKEGGNNV